MTEDEKARQREHTFPPDRLLPPDVLARYTLGHDVHDEAEVADYVNGQCRGDETVQYMEQVKTEYVSGERFDVWDVHTDKQRWWVLTNLINFYPQTHFPSLDFTLSFHIGLMHRLQSRQEQERGSREPDLLMRRTDDAMKLLT
jgi:hypothetical protein